MRTQIGVRSNDRIGVEVRALDSSYSMFLNPGHPKLQMIPTLGLKSIYTVPTLGYLDALGKCP